MLTKTCNKCSEVKELGQFHVSKNNVHGRKNICKACCTAANKIDYNDNKDKYVCWNLYSSYGVTLETYNKMLKQQDHTCAICKQPETAQYKGKSKSLSVDHNHRTGHIRQLLCHSCNVRLGYHELDASWPALADTYLDRHNKKPSGISQDSREDISKTVISKAKQAPTSSRRVLTQLDIDDIKLKSTDPCFTHAYLAHRFNISKARIAAILKVTH